MLVYVWYLMMTRLVVSVRMMTRVLTCVLTVWCRRADMAGSRHSSSVAGESLGPPQSVSGLVCYHLQSPDSSPGLSLVPASHTASLLVEAGCFPPSLRWRPGGGSTVALEAQSSLLSSSSPLTEIRSQPFLRRQTMN